MSPNMRPGAEAIERRKALSIMQPWAWLIVNGHKGVENRNWRCHLRGPVLIHAGKRIDRDAMQELLAGRHPVTGERLVIDLPETFATGGIVGEAVITGCVAHSDSPWFVGRYGILIREARPLPFKPCKGALGFFTPTLDLTGDTGGKRKELSGQNVSLSLLQGQSANADATGRELILNLTLPDASMIDGERS